ncbi:MAG: hypothetical protein R3C14_31335 [Caldilineaceae bacterium]
MNMPSFSAEVSLYKTDRHYQTGRQVINLSTQRISAIRPAVGMPGAAPFISSIRAIMTPTIGSVVAVPVNISGVYRDENGKCQLGTGGANHNLVAGAEIAGCRANCRNQLSNACAVEDGHGGCMVACNCDPLHKTCNDLSGGTFGGFGGDIPSTEGIGL